MKPIRILMTLSIIFPLMSIMVSATRQSEHIYEYCNPDVTVVFTENSSLSDEKQQIIADKLAGVDHFNMYGGDNLSNIICALFGHSLDETDVTATHHKVYKYEPRCRKDYYEVTFCTRCEYTEEVYMGSIDIYCHPEDLIN